MQREARQCTKCCKRDVNENWRKMSFLLMTWDRSCVADIKMNDPGRAVNPWP